MFFGGGMGGGSPGGLLTIKNQFCLKGFSFGGNDFGSSFGGGRNGGT